MTLLSSLIAGAVRVFGMYTELLRDIASGATIVLLQPRCLVGAGRTSLQRGREAVDAWTHL